MPIDVMAIQPFVLVEVLCLAGALPLSVIAARGFWHAPFGRLVRPLPVVFACFLVMDASNLTGLDLPRWYFYLLAVPGFWAASYAAVQGALLLTERREV
jgi:hypothetical protein